MKDTTIAPVKQLPRLVAQLEQLGIKCDFEQDISQNHQHPNNVKPAWKRAGLSILTMKKPDGSASGSGTLIGGEEEAETETKESRAERLVVVSMAVKLEKIGDSADYEWIDEAINILHKK